MDERQEEKAARNGNDSPGLSWSRGTKSVSDLSTTQAIAVGAAQKATKTRDTAAKALKAWVSEFRKIAKRVLRGRPDLAAKLEL